MLLKLLRRFADQTLLKSFQPVIELMHVYRTDLELAQLENFVLSQKIEPLEKRLAIAEQRNRVYQQIIELQALFTDN